jgi:hypothetical protein
VPSNSNFPASHLGSQLGAIAQSYRAFSSPPRGRATRFAQPKADHRPNQHQGPEFVVRSVRASSIRAIAIMTKAVEAKRIWALRAKLVCDSSLACKLYGERLLPICIESVKIRHHDDNGSIGTKKLCMRLPRNLRQSSSAVATSRESPGSGREGQRRHFLDNRRSWPGKKRR